MTRFTRWLPILSLLFASPAFAGVVQTASATGTGMSISVTIGTAGTDGSTQAVTAGDTLIIIPIINSDFSLTSPADTNGTVTTDIAYSYGASYYGGIGFYRVASAAAGVHTITFTYGSSQPWGIVVLEYDNITGFDKGSALSSAYGIAVTTSAITPTASDELVIGAVSATASGGVSITWTTPPTQEFSSTTTNPSFSVADQLQTTPTSVAISATLGASHDWGALLAAYTTTAGSSCTHAGHNKNGSLSVPNGTSGYYWAPSGNFVTPNCVDIKYWQPRLGNWGVN